MMIKNAMDKVKGRGRRALDDIKEISLSAADLRCAHFLVQPTGEVYQMAPLLDILQGRDTVEIDCYEPSLDAIDALTNICVCLGCPVVRVERGSEALLPDGLAQRVYKNARKSTEIAGRRIPAQYGMVL